MAHKVLDIIESPIKPRKARVNIQGKFGFSLMLGEKEVFIGISISPVIVEEVVKRRMVKTIKGKARVFNFD